MDKITKRDSVTGEELKPSDEIAVTNKAELVLPEDEVGSPDTPINDLRIENFLMDIVENAVTGTDNLYNRYCHCGFFKDAPVPVIKSQMRQLLNKPRVKERLKYLRQSEWDLNRPDIMNISKKLENLIEDEDLRPTDKINAINSLAKLVGMYDNNTEKKDGAKVAIVFNSSEAPPSSVTISTK